MKLSKVFEIVKPNYSYIKLTPNYSIRNNNTHALAKTISSTYRDILSSINKDKSKLIKLFGREFLMGTKYNFNTPAKVSYFIYIENKKVEFYLIVPQQYKSIIKEKVSDVWGAVTDSEVEELPWFSENAAKSQLVYKNKDALSLRTDRRSNELLNSNLNIIDVLKEDDKAGIFYNFRPISQLSWPSDYRHAINTVKAKLPVERNAFTLGYALKMAVAGLSGILNDISSTVKTQSSENALIMALEGLNKKGVSEATDKKATATILSTQIVAISESEDRLRQFNNLKSLTNSYDAIRSDDNELISKRHYKKFKPEDYDIKTEINKTSAEECQNFISLAGREILEKYSFIDQVSTQETQVPEELQKGVMCIGTSTYRGNEQKAFLSTDSEHKYLTLVPIGPTRAGKSTLFANLMNDGLKNNECNIVLDFCGNCELSDEMRHVTKSILNVDCDDVEKIQGLGYNEVKKHEDPFIHYKNTKSQATQLLALINAVNADDKKLAPKMERYLTAAALIVFINGGAINEVFEVLQNHKKRGRYILLVPEENRGKLEEYTQCLRELDEEDNKTGETIGTRDHLITGIIDRLNKLKINSYMEEMLTKDCSGNIDLVEEMQKSQIICIKLPDHMFTTDQEKDIMCTYWLSKIILALTIRKRQILDRKKHTKVNIFIDEIYQVENCQKLLSDKLSRLAKFSAKSIISCHYINQLTSIRNELKSANTSYMLVEGCDEDNYRELKSKLLPYTEEDLLKLERYHSLNVIKTKKGHATFITKMPTEIILP